MLIQQGTASKDGRLGSGKSVKAITSKGDGWDAPAIQNSFKTDLPDQIKRVFESAQQGLTNRRAGWDFVFVSGTVLGTNDADLILHTEDGAIIRLAVAIDHDGLAYRENMTLLARSPGLPIRCIGRLLVAEAGRVELLAIAPIESAAPESPKTTVTKKKAIKKKKATKKKADVKPALQLKQTHAGHVNLGLELLERNQFAVTERHPTVIPVSTTTSDDGLTALRQRVRAMALHGRHSLPSGKVNSLTIEAAKLSDSQPTAAALLQSLGASALDSSNDITGLRFPANASPLAQLWLASSHYSRSATQAFQQAEWQEYGSTELS
jgi:hypothetical protein